VADGLTCEHYVHFGGNKMIKMAATESSSTITQTLIDTKCAWLADI
jgi:hypothetical protein